MFGPWERKNAACPSSGHPRASLDAHTTAGPGPPEPSPSRNVRPPTAPSNPRRGQLPPPPLGNPTQRDSLRFPLVATHIRSPKESQKTNNRQHLRVTSLARINATGPSPPSEKVQFAFFFYLFFCLPFTAGFRFRGDHFEHSSGQQKSLQI